MPYRPFHDLLPDVAERETRSITVLPESNLGLPVGDYAFPEMFCDEAGCDCRRVFFYVVSSFRKDVEAVVAWGWENRDFYRRWMKYGDKKDADNLKGPILNLGSPQTELAPAILDLVRNVLLQDAAYVKRIQRHYTMFRERIDAQTGDRARKGKRNAQPGIEC